MLFFWIIGQLFIEIMLTYFFMLWVVPMKMKYVEHFEKKNKLCKIFEYIQLMLNAVLTCLFDSLNTMLRKNVEKKFLYENLDLVMLTIDEICDEG